MLRIIAVSRIQLGLILLTAISLAGLMRALGVRFMVGKLVQLVVVLLVATFLTYALTFSLEGDVVTTILQTEAGNQARRDEISDELNLDDSLPVQYGKWAGNAVTGDLGRSFSKNQTITQLLEDRLPRTLALVVYSQIIALGLAIPIGIIAAYRANTVADKVLSSTSFGLLSIPSFVMAILLIFLFALTELPDWIPRYGGKAHFDSITPSDLKPTDVHAFFLPALSLALGQVAVYMRLLRTDMIATLQEDFIGMAKAKGMPTAHILFKHALRPSSLSLLTVAGVTFGQLIGGSVIIEFIFGIQGMGALLIDSIFRRDVLAVQAIVAVVAIGFVLINFLVDIFYAILDPRIRHARAPS